MTFRLFDSLPRAVAEALAKLPDNLVKTDERLDGGLGECWLGEPAIAELVENAILHFDGERYRARVVHHAKSRPCRCRAYRWQPTGRHSSLVEVVFGQSRKYHSRSNRAVLAQGLLRQIRSR